MQNPLFGLYCTGGGAQGAYQVGVLKYIYERFCHDNNSPFQVYAGSSIGSINTSYCASMSHDSKFCAEHLEDLWLGFDIPEWHRNPYTTFIRSLLRHYLKPKKKRHATWSFLSPDPLTNIIATSIKRENMLRAFESGTTKGIAVSTTELLSGKTCWFQEGPNAKEWNFLRSHSRNVAVDVPHIQASCSAPFLFPPLMIDKHFFVDGSMSVKTPFNPIVNMGATRILCIASERPYPNRLPAYHDNFRPRPYHLYRMFEGLVSYNYSIEQAGTIKFINHFSQQVRNANRSQEKSGYIFADNGVYPEHYRPTDVFMFFPSKQIRQSMVYPLVDALARSRRTQFMFQKDFTSKLIELGYEDAKGRHKEFELFFQPEPKPFMYRFFKQKKAGYFEPGDEL